MDEQGKIRAYKDRLRICLILIIFGENYSDTADPSIKKLFKSEVRIQKIDFLLRNPDYLAYELLQLAASKIDFVEIKDTVKYIFETHEPTIRRLEMERFFFGAYEDIDDVIGFLKSIQFIDFSSKKSSDFRTIEKTYFIKEKAIERFNESFAGLPGIKWYVDKLNLIKKYFGDLSGTQLKVSQYKIDEYRNTSYNSYIRDIQQIVRNEYFTLYNEHL